MSDYKVVRFSQKDRVTFDQLPEQIRKHYQEVPEMTSSSSCSLTEENAFLLWGNSMDTWEKTPDGDWVITTSIVDGKMKGATGEGFTSPEERATFDQLPEQLRKHYQEDPFKLIPKNARIHLDETRACIMSDGPEPPPERALGWVDCWVKRPNGNWDLIVSGWCW